MWDRMTPPKIEPWALVSRGRRMTRIAGSRMRGDYHLNLLLSSKGIDRIRKGAHSSCAMRKGVHVGHVENPRERRYPIPTSRSAPAEAAGDRHPPLGRTGPH